MPVEFLTEEQERATEADVCMFVTLVRFEPAYHYHFKCNLWRLRD